MRVGFRTIVSLVICAAAAGAAVAHFAIDVIGDYALPKDSYDHLGHGSREMIAGVAFMLAAFLAARGLRACCEVAAANRTRLLRPGLRIWEMLGMLAGAVAASTLLVPAMECLDGRLAGVPVRELDDAFGGSITLGIGTTLVCAAAVALLVCGLAHFLISHRDSIATIILTIFGRLSADVRPNGYDRVGLQLTTRRRRAPTALRLAKRGPPATSFA
ncbi:MAG: hypothetical protein WAK19_09600 [Candidatus Cybelea sp.]